MAGPPIPSHVYHIGTAPRPAYHFDAYTPTDEMHAYGMYAWVGHRRAVPYTRRVRGTRVVRIIGPMFHVTGVQPSARCIVRVDTDRPIVTCHRIPPITETTTPKPHTRYKRNRTRKRRIKRIVSPRKRPYKRNGGNGQFPPRPPVVTSFSANRCWSDQTAYRPRSRSR